MNFMFEWQEQYLTNELSSERVRYLFLPREHKIHIFEPTCNGIFVIWRLNIEYFRFYCVPSQVLQIQLDFYIANRKTKVLGAKYIETLNPIKQNSVS